MIAAAPDAPVHVPVSEDDLAVLHYSSGSTGKIKAAMQSFGNRRACIRKVLFRNEGAPRPGDRIALVGPITHASGMLMQPFLYAGATLHLCGLLSDGNVHAHIDHVEALLAGADRAGVARVRLHVLADGRDVADPSFERYVARLQAGLVDFNGRGRDYRIASGGGRMTVTMDRYEADWRIVERGWQAHVLGEADGFDGVWRGVGDVVDIGPEEVAIGPCRETEEDGEKKEDAENPAAGHREIVTVGSRGGLEQRREAGGVAGDFQDALGDAFGGEGVDEDGGVSGDFDATAGVGGDGGGACVEGFQERDAEAFKFRGEQEGERILVDLWNQRLIEIAAEADAVLQAKAVDFGLDGFAAGGGAGEDQVEIGFALGGGEAEGFEDVGVILVGPEVGGKIEVLWGEF